MTTRPVAEYLMQFGAQADVEPALDLCGEVTISPIWKQELEEDLETALESARESGRVVGFEAAQAEFEATLDRERKSFEERLAAGRQEWTRKEGERLSETLAAALRTMEESIAESVARVLRPFIVDSLRRQMLDQLVDHIATMIGNNEKILIKIAGPTDLLDSLRERLASIPVAIDYEPRDSVDVSVVSEQTAIETQLQAWIDLIDAETEQHA